jgi:hypothetical protein
VVATRWHTFTPATHFCPASCCQAHGAKATRSSASAKDYYNTFVLCLLPSCDVLNLSKVNTFAYCPTENVENASWNIFNGWCKVLLNESNIEVQIFQI